MPAACFKEKQSSCGEACRPTVFFRSDLYSFRHAWVLLKKRGRFCFPSMTVPKNIYMCIYCKADVNLACFLAFLIGFQLT